MISRDNVKLLAELVTEGTNTRVSIGKSDSGWSWNGSTNTLNIPNAQQYADEEVGIVLHEVGHSRFTTSHKLKSQSEHELVNAMEDGRIEDCMEGVYSGAGRFFKKMNRKYGNESVRHLGRGEKTKQLARAVALARGGIPLEDIKLYADKEVGEVIADKWSEIMKRGHASTEAIGDALEDMGLAEIVRKWGKESDEKSGGSDNTKDKDESEREVKQGDTRKTEEETAMDFFKADAKNADKEIPQSDIELEQIIAEQVASELGMYRKIVARVRERQYTRYAGGYESGKVNAGKLAKLFTGRDTKLFTRKVAQREEDTVSYTVLVDASGSMASNTCFTPATIAGIAFVKACELAGMSSSLVFFNAEYAEVKTRNQHASIANILGRLLSSGVLTRINYRWNCDGAHIMRAVKEIAHNRGSKRIVIFSDGEPAPCGAHASHKHTIPQALALAEREGVKVESIGIKHAGVSRYYKRYQVAHKVDEIASKVALAFRA